MGLYLSDRQEKITQSEIRNMTLECRKAGGINLAQGVCNLPLSLPVKEGAQQAIDDGFNTYTRYDGLAELREAIAAKHKADNGMDIDPETQVVVSAGTTGAFYATGLALLNPGDEVIVFEPYYSYHVTTLKALEVKPVYVKLHLPHWAMKPEEIEKAVTPRTRGIIVNTPANPSGKVFSENELKTIADIAEKHDLFVFTDEIYQHFIYDGLQHVAPVTIEGMAERTVTISGFSKIFSITGWRIGYCICHEKWAQSIGYMNDLIYVCAPAPLQIGVSRGLAELDDSYYRKVAQNYQAKRNRFCAALDSAGLTPCVPEGAYYVLADTSVVPGNTSKEKSMELLRKTGIASVPGQAFYHDDAGANLARFCFAKEDEVIEEACKRIAGFS